MSIPITPPGQMPIGAAADKYSTPADLSPPIPQGAPPPPAAGMMGPPPAAPMPAGIPSMPPPSAPATPPWSVKLQADGSSAYILPSPDGDPAKDVVIGVNKAPKLPPALQPKKGP